MLRSILVGQDSSLESRKALDMSLWVASTTEARLTLLHMYGRKLPEFHPENEAFEKKNLEDRVRVCRKHKTEARIAFTSGKRTPWLLQEACWFDLVVLGKRGASHRRHSKRIGSFPEAMLAASPSPVLIVDDNPHPPRSIVVFFDGTSDACRALRIAAMLGKERKLKIHLAISHGLFRRSVDGDRAAAYLREVGVVGEIHRLKAARRELRDFIEFHKIHLTFLPALAGWGFGQNLSEYIASETSSSILLPEGRVPPVY